MNWLEGAPPIECIPRLAEHGGGAGEQRDKERSSTLALALRSLCSVRVQDLTEYVVDPLKKGLADQENPLRVMPGEQVINNGSSSLTE